jgi:CRISPR-associated protein Cas1
MSSLYIDRRGVELEADGEALVFRENGERIGTVPLAPLSRIFLRGDVRLQSSLLGKLGARGIGVIILSGRKSEPTLLMARPHNDAAKRIAQYKMSQDGAFCLAFARKLVQRKLSSQHEWLASLQKNDLEHRYELALALRKLDGIMTHIVEKDSIAALMGVEGAGAAAYFEGLAAIAPPRLKFTQRNRRPPRDPLNALLSLGYTLLHAEAVLALYGAGLDPYIGFYHQLDFGRESLACDVVEPLRVQVDAFSLDLFRKDNLRIEDFSTTESGCLLGKNGRAKFYGAWETLAEKFRKQLSEQVDEMFAHLISGDLPLKTDAGANSFARNYNEEF